MFKHRNQPHFTPAATRAFIRQSTMVPDESLTGNMRPSASVFQFHVGGFEPRPRYRARENFGTAQTNAFSPCAGYRVAKSRGLKQGMGDIAATAAGNADFG